MPEPLQTIDVAPLSLRALVAPKSVNADNRTVELTFSTGAAVERMDWLSGSRYLERLSLDPQHIRLDRLNAGAPLLDTHDGYSLRSMLGAVVPESAQLVGKHARATVQFSRRAEVEPFFQDVRDGIIRNVSVGYRVYAYDEQPAKKGGLPTRTAIDWEPFELSMVPMPADAGAQVRTDKSQVVTNPCSLLVRGDEPTGSSDEGKSTMEQQPKSDAIVERDPLDPGAPTARAAQDPPAPPAAPTDAELGATRERERVEGIIMACRVARMTSEFQDTLIKSGVNLAEAQGKVFSEMRSRGAESVPTVTTGARVEGGPDPFLHQRAGIEEALAHRIAGDMRKKDGSSYFPLTEKGRKYRGLSMLDTARIYLQARGVRTTDMSRMELAGAALGLTDVRGGGMHTTSDFANLLADVANKTLRAAYEEQPQTFRPLVRVVSIADFKTVNRVQLGDAPALLEILEDGEYKSGTISDGKESYGLTTYGRKFAITRKALINDDTDAFSRVPMMFGRKARVLESNLVWEQITSNPVMGDTNALFSAAHSNLETDGDHLSIASLSRARTSLRQQTSLDGDYLNLSAAAILVPTTLETVAQQFTSAITPNLSGSVNPFVGISVIAEPRLDANSETAWYLAASVSSVDIIELAYLDGAEGPSVESRIGFDIDGLEIKCRLDVAAKVIDWRGLHKDPGDLAS